jgi:hypothetical protein
VTTPLLAAVTLYMTIPKMPTATAPPMVTFCHVFISDLPRLQVIREAISPDYIELQETGVSGTLDTPRQFALVLDTA